MTKLVSTKTLSICLSLAVLAIIAVSVFKVPLSTVLFSGILLLCPLLHLWMMKGGDHKH